jgi:hypothetical protein
MRVSSRRPPKSLSMSRSILAWKRPAPELSSGNGPCSFPNSPRAWWQKFNLINQKHREHVRDVIMPAAIANKEAILKSPREIDRIIAEHLKATAATVQKEAAEKKVVAAIKALPAREREVIFYGERMWPVVNPTYDFDQLCAAIWSFQDLNRWLLQTPDNSVGSRGRIIRFTQNGCRSISTAWCRPRPGRGSRRSTAIVAFACAAAAARWLARACWKRASSAAPLEPSTFTISPPHGTHQQSCV